MFKALLDRVKKFFADDPSDLGAEELVDMVLDQQTPEDERREGAEQLGSLSDTIGELSASDTEKGALANRCFTKLASLLERPGEPLWIYVAAVSGMNEIINVCRYEMDSATLEAGIEALINRAGDGYPDELRGRAASCISSFGDQVSDDANRRATQILLANVRQTSGELRADSLHSLGCIDSKHTAQLWAEVASYLADPSASVRANAATALWMIGQESPEPGVLDQLVQLMQSDPEVEVRRDCANALGILGKEYPPVVAALSAALDDDPRVRHMAIFALLEFEQAAASAVPALARYLDNDDAQDSVVMALQAIGTEQARKLLRDNGHDEEA